MYVLKLILKQLIQLSSKKMVYTICYKILLQF